MFVSVLQSFLLSPNGSPLGCKAVRLVTQFRHQMANILQWFRTQKIYWFRNSSILVVYNAEYFDNWDSSWTEKMHLFEPDGSVSSNSSKQTNSAKINDILTDVNSTEKPVDTLKIKKTCTSEISSTNINLDAIQSNESCSKIYENGPNTMKTNGDSMKMNGDSMKVNGDSVMTEHKDDEPELILRVKMIDFAHVLEADGEVDHRYISGLCDIIQLCDSILQA